MAQHFEEFYSDTFGCLMKQIRSNTARKIFDAGHTVYFHPSKMRFDNPWQSPVPMSRDSWDSGSETAAIDPFDNACNHYRFYNCDSERGKDIHYFIQIK